ncbi:unnamed protein product [Cutaneotrichosporon oleaginosum]
MPTHAGEPKEVKKWGEMWRGGMTAISARKGEAAAEMPYNTGGNEEGKRDCEEGLQSRAAGVRVSQQRLLAGVELEGRGNQTTRR